MEDSVEIKDGEEAKKSMRTKLSIGFVVFAAAVTIAAVIVGSGVYRSDTYERYDIWAYNVASVAASYFTTDEILYYTDVADSYLAGDMTDEELAAIKESDEYKAKLDELDNLRKGLGANDIMVVNIKATELENYDAEAAKNQEVMPMHYLFDSYYKEDQRVYVGDTWWIVQEFADNVKDAINTGEDPDEYMVVNGSYGYTINAVHPMVYNGETIALVMVEMPMSSLQSDINNFRIKISLVALIVTIILLMLAIWLIVRFIINPIILVADEAGAFVTNNTTISHRLGTIRTRDEIESLSRSILSMEVGINKYIEELTAATAEKERIGAELNVATRIQADMLPQNFPDNDYFNLYATMTPAKEVGGDFYDFFWVDDKHFALVMADVSGKGIPAALFMVIAKTLIKNAVLAGMEPGAALTAANAQLCESNGAELFVTVWLGILDVETGHITASNAGHEYPCIRGARGGFEMFKDKHSIPLGSMEFTKYKQYEMQLEKGGSLYLYTDGVTEATDSDNRLFGNDGLMEALNASPDTDPSELLPTVRSYIDRFVGDASQFDDITMMAIKIKN